MRCCSLRALPLQLLQPNRVSADAKFGRHCLVCVSWTSQKQDNVSIHSHWNSKPVAAALILHGRCSQDYATYACEMAHLIYLRDSIELHLRGHQPELLKICFH